MNIDSGLILQIAMVITGVILLCITFSSLAKHRMTAPFSLTWGIVSVMFILAGILLRPAGWKQYISHLGLLLLFLVGACVVYGTLFVSFQVSTLMRKTNEMALLLSLMEQENEKLEERVTQLEKQLDTDNVKKEDGR